jgi:phenylacetate-CoA ligase
MIALNSRKITAPASAEAQDAAFRAQVAYLFARSAFYHDKLSAAGFTSPEAVGGLAEIDRLPFTEKDELRASRSEANPIGAHLACEHADIARIYSTSGTTGTPSYIPLTARDIEDWVTISARSYSASGVARGDRVITSYNAGPFVAGAALAAFDKLGLCHIPVGTGNTERLITAVQALRPDAVVVTPSYALHLAEWAAARGIDLPASSVRRVMVAGEPGGGEPEMRARLEAGWGAKVTEAMGIGDIAVSLWGECEAQDGMHFNGDGFIHVELIEPETGAVRPFEDGAEGELVYTHLRQQAAPLLRFRSRDHVEVRMSACPCGRSAPRIRCIGRTDDMLIVRGVNVFPTALREVVGTFAPAVSGLILITPETLGVKQEPPLPLKVELAEGRSADASLAEQIEAAIRAKLIIRTIVDLVPFGSLPRSEYKSKLMRPAE